MRPRTLIVVVLVASLAGLFFAAFSTYDFVEHLDRQVHELHCSFIPGLAHTDASGSSGCHVTLMSPYSSVMRATVWGGIPISLPAMSVFSFLAFWCLYVLVQRRDHDARATGFLALATCVPLLASLVMAGISITTLHAACKLCIGIYVSSALAFGCAAGAFSLARRRPRFPSAQGAADTVSASDYDPARDPYSPPMPWISLVAAFALGLAFVGVPIAVYGATLPDYAHFVGQCGTLPQPADPYGVMVPLDGHTGGTAAIEVLDPLCPSCRAFEDRLEASGLDDRLQRKAVLFPLDRPCNWMVDTAVHPGSCAVSEAVLCAGDDARTVLAWAFANQDAIKEAAAHDPHAAERMAKAQFPDLARCIGSPLARARLDRSLRWAVQNRLPVLTPQLYVGGRKLCDEDTDLGMDYALTRMLAHGGGG